VRPIQSFAPQQPSPLALPPPSPTVSPPPAAIDPAEIGRIVEARTKPLVYAVALMGLLLIVTMCGTTAIGLYLADRYAPGRLAPKLDDAARGTYFRWSLFAPSVIEPGSMARAGKWEFRAGAASEGLRVLEGGCVDLGDGARPYDPFVAALRPWLRSLPAEDFDRIVGPGNKAGDLSLVRLFRFGTHAVEARVESFNAFNWFNPGPTNAPVTNLNNPQQFGTITSADDPRIMQFALKYSF
jgi:hypothetical protein